jgi:hypothetical protein
MHRREGKGLLADQSDKKRRKGAHLREAQSRVGDTLLSEQAQRVIALRNYQPEPIPLVS